MTKVSSSFLKATIVVTARDRFSVAIRSLTSLAETSAQPYDLIYIDAGSPRKIAAELESICARHGFRYVRFDTYLSACQSRNIGHRLAATPYVVFVENDVMFTPGWLQNLVRCADETGADVVQPLICEGVPLHTEIHSAGGSFTDDLEAFLKAPKGTRRIGADHLPGQGHKIGDWPLARAQTQITEMHGLLVRKDAFARFGDFDEHMPCSKDHIDFSMTVCSKGGRIFIEPSSVITFCVPGRHYPVTADDLGIYLLRWSHAWQINSLTHFQAKWQLEDDPYFNRYRPVPLWRIREGVAKQLARQLPLVGRSWKVQQTVSAVLMPVLRMIGDALAWRYAAAAKPRNHDSDLPAATRMVQAA